MNRIGHDRTMTYKSLSDRLMYHVRHPVFSLRLSKGLESRKTKLFDYISTPGCTERLEACLFISICSLLELCLLFILQFIFVHRDVVFFCDLGFGHVDSSGPTGRAKKCVDAK